jgi:virulence-associated protein VagC
MSSAVARRASIFRNGANQAVRLPQDLRFPEDVKEVRIRKQGDGLFITPVKPDWVIVLCSGYGYLQLHHQAQASDTGGEIRETR